MKVTGQNFRKICAFALEFVVLIWLVGIALSLIGLPPLISVIVAAVLAVALIFLQKKFSKTTLGERLFCADDATAFRQLPIAKQARIVICTIVLLVGVILLVVL